MITSADAGRRTGPRLALLAFAQFIIAVDYNIVYVALPRIGGALGFTAQSLQWVVSAYAVGFGGLLLFGGRAVDRIGKRRLFQTALVLYAVASLGGGLATDGGFLIAARAVQGVGGALLFPATLSLIMTHFEEGPARTKAMGAWGAAGGAGLSAGALLGGVFTQYIGWQWVFFVNVPLAALALVAAPILLHPDGPRTRSGGFDLPGALFAGAGAAFLVFGLVNGPSSGWVSLGGAGAIGLGVVLLVVFAVVERFSADPLMPLGMFRNPSLAPSMAVILVYQGALGASYYLLTTYLQSVLGYDAIEAGLGFLPLTVISVYALGQVGPRMIGRWGVRTTLLLSMLGTGIGLAGIVAGMTVGGTFWAVLPGIAFFGLAGGVAFVTMFVAAGTGVAPSQQGVSSALASTSQQVGGAMGLAALIAVADSRLHAASIAAAGHADLVAGVRLAGFVGGAATVAGAFLALAIRAPKADGANAVPVDAAGSDPAVVPVGS